MLQQGSGHAEFQFFYKKPIMKMSEHPGILNALVWVSL